MSTSKTFATNDHCGGRTGPQPPPSHATTSIIRDADGRVLPGALLAAHARFESVCEANSLVYARSSLFQAHNFSSVRCKMANSAYLPMPRDASTNSFPSPSTVQSDDTPRQSRRFSDLVTPADTMPGFTELAATAEGFAPGSVPPAAEPVSVFQSRTLPGLSLYELAPALERASKCCDDALLAGLVLAWRYCAATSTKPTLHSMHRLYVGCLHLAIKTHSDEFFRNSTFARFAGIGTLELNRLEMTIAAGVRWRLLVQPEDVEQLFSLAGQKALVSQLRLHAPQSDDGVSSRDAWCNERASASPSPVACSQLSDHCRSADQLFDPAWSADSVHG
jgi:hypothetical protein